jgi:hypothetical protein
MDGVEQPLLLERFPTALNRAGPADALAGQGSVKGADSVTQLLGDGRVGDGRALPDYSVVLSLKFDEHRQNLLPINQYTAYSAYRFYIIRCMERSGRSTGGRRSSVDTAKHC